MSFGSSAVIRTVVVSLVLGCAGRVAHAEGGTEACTRRAPRDGLTLVIDANTGERLTGGTQFPQGSQIKVVITRKNPFKYSYRVETAVTPLEETIALAFLKLIPTLPDLSNVVVSDALKQAGGAGAGAPPNCGGATTAWTELSQSASGSFARDADDLTAVAKELKAISDQYDKFRTDTNKDQLVPDADTTGTACKTVCDAAARVQASLPKLSNLGTRPAEAKKLQTVSAKVTAGIQAFESARDQLVGVAKTQCEAETGPLLADIKKTKDAADKASETVQKLDASKAEFEASKKLLDVVLADESAFEEVIRPFVPDSPTNVQVTVYRTNLRVEQSKEQRIVSIPIHVGKSRFAISAGFGFSTLDSRVVARLTGPVPDGKGGTKTGSVFGLSESSTFQPEVAVLLNATLFSTQKKPIGLGHVGFALTTGIITNGTGDDRRLDYLAGGSLTLLDNQLFLSVTLHAGRVQELKGYELNTPIPADLNDPLPTTTTWHTGAFFGLTYRIR